MSGFCKKENCRCFAVNDEDYCYKHLGGANGKSASLRDSSDAKPQNVNVKQEESKKEN